MFSLFDKLITESIMVITTTTGIKVITDIFPIRFITKYNYDLKFEALYYIFYLILCSICL